MATSIFINNQRTNLPGVYSTIKSGITNQALALAFGNTLALDLGGGAGYGGGGAINGQLTNGKDAVYTFTALDDFRNFVGGGLWWLLGQPLFLPGGGAANGISSLTYVKCATTTSAQITILLGGQGSHSDGLSNDNGSVTLKTKIEGLAGNGSLLNNVLTRGVGVKIVQGVFDVTKFIVKFYRGTFKGLDTAVSNGDPYDFISEANTQPVLLCQSPEVKKVADLVAWMQDINGAGYLFSQYFQYVSSVIASNDQIVTNDLTPYYLTFSGGTETFSPSDLSKALDVLASQNWDFILTDQFNVNALSALNQTVQAWVANTLKIKPDLYIAAGKTQGQFTTSQSVAATYNSQYVTVVHGGVKVTAIGGRTFKEYDSIYHAADALGREAGLAPQIPLTFKNLGIQGESHSLTDKEASIALDAGLLVSRFDDTGNGFEVVKGVNSLQNNQFLVNTDGTTSSKQLARIIRQLNKEIVVNAKQQLLKKPDGSNRNTVSPQDVKTWLSGYLNSKVATNTSDNLILTFGNINVKVVGDSYQITYSFVPNFEVSFLVFTGTIIDPNQ